MRKFLLYCSIILLAGCMQRADAQDSCTVHKKNDIVIGIDAGAQTLLTNMPSMANYSFTTGVFGKKYINNKLAVNFELKYGEIKKLGNGGLNIISQGTEKIYNVSIPVTIEYYFLPGNKKLKPFAGAGVVYNVYQEKSSTINLTDGNAKEINTVKTRTSYASLIITQGFTYDISPKIQVKECIHVVPHACCKASGIGFEAGIGFKL